MEQNLDKEILALKGPIFIFGASGFIGANILETILKHRKDCYAITHEIKRAWRLKLLNLNPENILFCDILFKNSVNQIFEKYKPKTVFNLAAYGAYSKQNQNNLIYETNLLGTLNILEECVKGGIRSYVHAGSSSEYGFNCENSKESDELIPNSHYSVSKISASYLLKFYAKIHELPCLNLRLYSVYGPWEEPDRLIPVLIDHAKQQKFPPLVSPDISRDFIYTEDCTNAFIKAALHLSPSFYGESVNIGTGKKTTIRELVETTIQLFNLSIKPEWGSMPDRKWDLQNWYGNYDKAKALFHWEPVTPLSEGLLKTSQWQDQHDYHSSILPAFSAPKKITKISCVIACYKDAQAIPYMYDRLVKMFTELKTRYEIIFVNDSSPDDTEKILNVICQKDANVIAITHSRNFGSQSAFLSGMEISTGDAVVLLDGDLQDPPELIPEFYKKWLDGFDVVYGRRIKREASHLMNMSYKLFYKIFSNLSYIKIPRDAGDFSLMD